jgi:hypothetical protein
MDVNTSIKYALMNNNIVNAKYIIKMKDLKKKPFFVPIEEKESDLYLRFDIEFLLKCINNRHIRIDVIEFIIDYMNNLNSDTYNPFLHLSNNQINSLNIPLKRFDLLELLIKKYKLPASNLIKANVTDYNYKTAKEIIFFYEITLQTNPFFSLSSIDISDILLKFLINTNVDINEKILILQYVKLKIPHFLKNMHATDVIKIITRQYNNIILLDYIDIKVTAMDFERFSSWPIINTDLINVFKKLKTKLNFCFTSKIIKNLRSRLDFEGVNMLLMYFSETDRNLILNLKRLYKDLINDLSIMDSRIIIDKYYKNKDGNFILDFPDKLIKKYIEKNDIKKVLNYVNYFKCKFDPKIHLVLINKSIDMYKEDEKKGNIKSMTKSEITENLMKYNYIYKIIQQNLI